MKPKNSRRDLACKIFRTTPGKLADMLANWHRLTDREGEIARVIAEGKANAEIAKAAGITDRTLEVHRVAIKRKLGVPMIGVPRAFYALRIAGLIR